MATLALSVVGAAAGSALLPGGVSILGATLSGAAIGAQVGALAGAFVDQALFGASGESRTVEGPRLRDLHVTASSEGAPIPRVYGRVRLGGQVIWATDFEEEVIRTADGGSGAGGKGLGSGGGASAGGSSAVERIEYRYYANLAVAICEGEITGLRRVWADGAEIDLSLYTHRVYRGGVSQSADPLIVAREGGDAAPAYRGVAYVVFERLPLAEFGNRIPQLSFEVHRAIDDFNERVRAVVLIPGSGEFVYSPEEVNLTYGIGGTQPENVHTRQGGTDWTVAIDQLREDLPNVANISFVVSWFGTDLRAGHCEIRPGVEFAAKSTEPYDWRAGGVDRAEALLVSRREGRPAYGGTPSDRSVVAAIRDLKSQGYGVTVTPFVLMDVAEGNGLPNPYGGVGQPVYPWRGRITCDPAPGLPGTPDKTAAAAAQVANFVGSAQPGHFTISGDEVLYAGPGEWSYRRMVLHQAHLAKAAGGVDAFLLGTELRGLTWIRDGAGSYPFVAALVALAADVKGILGAATKVTYAADWTEYFGHQPPDGSGDVYFHLDPLWSASSIDAVGIDCYWPLSDWRDGRSHADYAAGARSLYDLGYLTGNIAGGEGYDWYYASPVDREAQIRTPITDGSGKPWVFRYKDARSWWENFHYDRPAGVEAGAATNWVPQSKPIWLMEIGCPATDKGANQPNVFVDPKSSENALPYFSRGRRDDLMQRRYVEALIEGFDPSSDHYIDGLNPVSSVYGGRMVDPSRLFVYCWDARPYPAFPFNLEVWGDGENWRLGHWLNGRLSGVPLSALVAAILAEGGFEQGDAGRLAGIVPGFVVDRPMSPREALQPLSLAYFFDAVETGAGIAFRHRGAEGTVARFSADDLVETKPGSDLYRLTRGQETDLPASAKIGYLSGAGGYASAIAEARRLVGASGRLAQAELPLVLDDDQSTALAETWLHETWSARERASFVLPPEYLDLEPGDIVELESAAGSRAFRITEITDHAARTVDGLSIDPDIYDVVSAPGRVARAEAPPVTGTPELEFLDLPLMTGREQETAGYVAAAQVPWPGLVAVYGSPEDSGFALRALLPAPAAIGETLDDLPPGPTSRVDWANRLRVRMTGGELASVSRLKLLSGGNALAVAGRDGLWEIVQFETAALVGSEEYELAGLLRGQAGTESAMAAAGSAIDAGTRIVVLDGAVTPVDLAVDELRLPYTWRYGDAGRSVEDPSYANRIHVFTGLGMRPYAPVHVRGERDPSGDLTVSWVRRTRFGGDNWEALEVPLGEESERYELDILDGGGAVIRTLSATSPEARYTAAEQVADFGGPQAAVSVRVSQIGAVYVRGVATAATL